MRPTFLGFETQRRTLMLAQKNQDIVGNNISNINTPGYTRQRVDIYSMYVSGLGEPRWSSRSNMLSMQGQGANAYGVSQIRDTYIDKRYRENVSIESETETKINVLSDIEDILDNFETTGLQRKTQDFWNALQDYSEEKPDSTEVATIAANAAVNLCRMLNDYSSQLKQVEDTYVNELKDNVEYVNKMLNEMRELNERIEKEKFHYAEEYGPNELYDEMNLYIDELGTYGEISVHQNANGTYDVTMGGVKILDGIAQKNSQIIMKEYDIYGTAELYFQNGQDVILTRGSFKAYQDMINGNGVYAAGGQNSNYGIAYFKSAINMFARTVADTLNTANGADNDSFRAMFVSATEDSLITAGNIRVSDDWLEDPTMIGKVRYFNEKTGLYEYGFDEKSDTPVTKIKYEQAYETETNADGSIKYDADGLPVPKKDANGNIVYIPGSRLRDKDNNLVPVYEKNADGSNKLDANGKPIPVYETVDGTASGTVNLQNTNVKYLFSQFDNKNIEFGYCHDFTGSYFEYISFISNRLGQTIEYETSRNETAKVTVDELLDSRDSVSGVQMDEEGINMLNYSKWYNASSRMLTTLDDMLDKLINGTGRVGL